MGQCCGRDAGPDDSDSSARLLDFEDGFPSMGLPPTPDMLSDILSEQAVRPPKRPKDRSPKLLADYGTVYSALQSSSPRRRVARPLAEPPILNYSKFDEEGEMMEEYFKILHSGHFDRTTNAYHGDIMIEEELMEMYSDWTGERLDEALLKGNKDADGFYKGLWRELEIDKAEIGEESEAISRLLIPKIEEGKGTIWESKKVLKEWKKMSSAVKLEYFESTTKLKNAQERLAEFDKIFVVGWRTPEKSPLFNSATGRILPSCWGSEWHKRKIIACGCDEFRRSLTIEVEAATSSVNSFRERCNHLNELIDRFTQQIKEMEAEVAANRKLPSMASISRLYRATPTKISTLDINAIRGLVKEIDRLSYERPRLSGIVGSFPPPTPPPTSKLHTRLLMPSEATRTYFGPERVESMSRHPHSLRP